MDNDNKNYALIFLGSFMIGTSIALSLRDIIRYTWKIRKLKI